MTDAKTKTKTETVKSELPGEWKERPSSISVTFHSMTGPRVYVVKRDNLYLRIPQAGARVFGVKSSRLATRFDSALWAASWASMVGVGADGKLPRVVRLISKTEREVEKVPQTSTYTWKAETVSASATKNEMK